MEIKKIVKNVIISVIAAVVMIVCLCSTKVITEGSVGIRYRLGSIVEEGMPAGFYFHAPFIERIETVDITEQSIEFAESCYTKDIQTVENVSVKINYQYNTQKLSTLIRNIGLDNIESKIIKPQVESVLKNEIGKYKGEELVANRTVVQENVEEIIRNNVKDYGINIISLSIQNIDFDDSFEAVIADKVASEQKLLTAKTEAEKVKVEAEGKAEAQKISADAEAYAINVVNEAMSAMDSDAYVRLQWIEKWDGKMPEGVMSNGTVLYGLGQE